MDLTAKKNIKKILFAMRYKLTLLALFFIFSFIALAYVQTILIEKTHLLGREMARSYSIDQEKNFRAYTTALRLAGEDLERVINRRSSDVISASVYEVLQNLQKTFRLSDILPYAIINNKVFFLDPETEKKANKFNIKNVEWYELVTQAGGEVICTNAYRNRLNGQFVITFAMQTELNEVIIAFDIFPKDFKDLDNSDILPDDCYYYLFDQTGTLLYSTFKKLSSTDRNSYAATIFETAHSSPDKEYSFNLVRPDGAKRTVYFSSSSNGWLSVVTLPHSYLMKDIYHIGAGAFFILFIFLAITTYTTLREVQLNQNINRTSDTIQVLGNSYYAIYRMNFIQNTYEMIKDASPEPKRIKPKGSYDKLLSVISKNIEPSTIQEFIDNFSAEHIKFLISQKTYNYGGDFKKKFGKRDYQWVNVQLLFDEKLDNDEAVLCFRFIDDEKQAQLRQLELLRSSLESAHQSEQARNMFFSSMSHDMRTPLNAIIGLSELAHSHIGEPQKITEYLNKITISSKHLLDLINDILEISRLEQGKMNVEKKQINLKTCVEECIAIFQTRSVQEEKHFVTEFSLQDNMVYGDPFRLSQILNNLLSNAFKFTQKDDTVTLKVKQLGKNNFTKYQFEITDTGIGMSKEFLEKIFVPYERETKFGAKNIQGTGLGTAIVKNIISHLGGEITVTSELGKGSSFTVTIPFETVKNTAEDQEQKAEKESSVNFLEGKKVLLAEDNMINMEIGTELLSMNGIEVVQAWDGQEAVDIFKNSEPFYFDFILMDMQMPNMSGCEATEIIRAMDREDAKTIPIIAVTANAFAEDFAATSAAGMNAHISKPIDFALLTKTMENFIK